MYTIQYNNTVALGDNYPSCSTQHNKWMGFQAITVDECTYSVGTTVIYEMSQQTLKLHGALQTFARSLSSSNASSWFAFKTVPPYCCFNVIVTPTLNVPHPSLAILKGASVQVTYKGVTTLHRIRITFGEWNVGCNIQTTLSTNSQCSALIRKPQLWSLSPSFA